MKKRILSIAMSIALVAATVINPMISYAEDDTIAVDIANYRSEDGNHATPTDITPEGKVFAGWYTDDTYSTAISEDTLTGTAVPKWVDADVFGAKYQVVASATIKDETTGIRLLTSVDSADYAAVGFVLNVNGRESEPAWSYKVYDTVKAKIDGQVQTLEANQVFDETASKYFVVHEIAGVPNDMFKTDIQVTPQWKTMDGTVVRAAEEKGVTAEIYTAILAQYTQEVTDFTTGGPNPIFIDVPLKMGQSITYDLTVENPCALMPIYTEGIYNNGGSDAALQLHADKVVSSTHFANNKITVTGNATRDVSYVRLRLIDWTAWGAVNSTWSGGKVTVSNIRITDELSYSGYTTAANTISIPKSVTAGHNISFDLAIENPTENTAVWVIGVYNSGSSSQEASVGVYNFSNKENHKIAFSVNAMQDYESFRIKVEQRDNYTTASSAWTSGTVTVSNLSVEDKSVWSFSAAYNEFNWYRAAEAGKPVTFDLSVENMTGGYVVVNALIGVEADGTNHWYKDGVTLSQNQMGANKTAKITFTPQHDIKYFIVRMRDWASWGTENASWTRGKVTFSNVVNQEIYEITPNAATYEYVWKKTVAAEKTITFDLSFENGLVDKYVVLSQIIGNPSTTANWYKADVVLKPADFADDGVYTVSFKVVADTTDFRIKLIDWDSWGTAKSAWSRGRVYISNVTIE